MLSFSVLHVKEHVLHLFFSIKKPEVSTIQYNYKIVQPYWQTLWQFFKRLNIKLPQDQATPFLDSYKKEMKIFVNI